MKQFKKPELLTLLYWSTPVILFIFQFLITNQATTQIRYEELAESGRNVFWLANHQIYDGVSNGVGWYSVLLVIYKIFGYGIFTAKYVRLALWLISLFSLAALLLKYLKVKWAFLPLITIGLSPSILFFNIIQSEYGLDIQMLPIYLLILSSINFTNFWPAAAKSVLLWIIVMIGASGYPTFVYYLPLLGLIYLWKLVIYGRQIGSKWFLPVLRYPAISLVSFVLPLAAIFAYLEPDHRQILLYDSAIESGIFRGSGSFSLEGDNFSDNLAGVFNDLFNTGDSYYFEAIHADFSHFLPAITFLLILSLSISYGIKNPKLRVITLLVLLNLALNLIISSLTFDVSGRPGLRRYTPTLASIYGLMAIVWYQLSQQKTQDLKKSIIIGLLICLPLHHLLVFPDNFQGMKVTSPYSENLWFISQGTPAQSLKQITDTLQKQDLKLICPGQQSSRMLTCRYSEVYAILSGSCQWNHLSCHQILGYDPQTQSYIPLSTDLWQTYYFEH